MTRAERIINSVITEYKIPRERLYGAERVGTSKDVIVSAARWKIIHELRNADRPMSYPQIGKILKLNHTTIINAAKKMKQTDGRYFDDKIKNLCPSSVREHRRKNRKCILAKLKIELQKGLIINQGE